MAIHEHVTREVDRAPAGPETVAFFDMDGTLIFGFSIAALFRERVQSRKLHPREAVMQFFSLLGHGISGATGRPAILRAGAFRGLRKSCAPVSRTALFSQRHCRSFLHGY